MSKAANWLKKNGRPVPANAGHIRANRELALFSAIFNFARQIGLTEAPNPCAGVRKNKEHGRDVYIEDDLFDKVWQAADEPTRDAMDLAYLAGQRPADTLKLTESDIKDSFLHIQQGKTRMKLRMQITGKLAKLIERIKHRKAMYQDGYIVSSHLIINESGKALTVEALRSRFDLAREKAGIAKAAFQFRDLRAKAGTDKTDLAGDIRQAQKQLGHRSVTMTEHYVRNRKGDKIGPTK